MKLTSSPEISVRNYHYSLRNNSEEGISYLLSGESLRSPIMSVYSVSLVGMLSFVSALLYYMLYAQLSLRPECIPHTDLSDSQ